MLDTSFNRSGWTFKRMRLKTKWAVEIARQKVFGTRPIRPIKVIEPTEDITGVRVLPVRKAAVKAKERLKEMCMQDQDKCNESNDDPTPLKSKKSGKGPEKYHLSKLDSKNSNGSSNNIGCKRGNKNLKQRHIKVGKNKARKLTRKEKRLLKHFKIKPCIVCIPMLTDKPLTVHKSVENISPLDSVPALDPIQTEHPFWEQISVNVNTEPTCVNKRKRKKPLRIIKKIGESGWNPIVVSDEDSDIENVEPNLTPLTEHLYSPLLLNDDSDDADDDKADDDDDDDDLISIADVNDFTNDDNDPNDADTEEDEFDFMDNINDSFDENSEVFTDIDGDRDDSINGDENDSYSDDDDEEGEEEEEEEEDGYAFDDDDEALTFSKAQSPNTYSSIRGKTLIAPATFQPTKFKVSPPKFTLPPTLRAGAF